MANIQIYGRLPGGGGSSNYNDLSNKPQINGVELTGNKTSADLGISGGSNTLIYKINTNLYNFDPDEPSPIAITDEQDIETFETIIENFGENKLIFFYFIVDNIPHYRFIESAKETEIKFYAYSYIYLGTFEKIDGNWQYMQYA